MRRLLPLLLAGHLAIQPVLVYALDLPDLGNTSEAVLSRQQEQAIGDQVMGDIRMARDVIDDPEAVDYLNRLGQRLVAASPDNRQRFEFFLVDDPTLNAFAMPGGYIGVHSGLIMGTQGESELASVLAHEISHVVQRHLARMLEKQQQNRWLPLALLAAAMLAARGNSQVPEAAIATSQALAIQNTLNFTRENEYEADRVGIGILASAGFDPRAMPTFFGRLERANRVYENNAPVYLRTHPLDSARIAESQNRANQYPYKQVADSPEFHLVRERLRALSGNAKERINYYKQALNDHKYNSEGASRYGLAVALWRDHQYAASEQALAEARKKLASPMMDSLAGQLALDQGDAARAVKLYQDGLARNPGQIGLQLGLIKARLRQKNAAEAVKQAQSGIDHLADSRTAAPYFELLAEGYAQQGKDSASQQAQAEYYYRQGRLQDAIQQLQLALKAKDNDFYRQSAIEARLKELRAEEDLLKQTTPSS